MARRYVRRSPMEHEQSDEGIDWRDVMRGHMAVALVLALVAIFVYTINTATTAEGSRGQERSAVQVAQIYTEGAFLAVIAIGIGIAAYIGTHAGE